MPDIHDLPSWPVAPALAVAIATGNYQAAGLLLLTAAAEENAEHDPSTQSHEQPQQTPQATAGRPTG